MDGVHDMGGMDGFGRVEPEANEPVFHQPWEGRVLAMTRALGAGGAWTIDQARFAREVLPPSIYLTSSYYWRWFLGLEASLVELGFVGADEIAAGHARGAARPLPRGTLAPTDVPKVLKRGSFERPPATPARFGVGERVRARNIHPKTHTRLPRYARGRAGRIERIQGCHVFPDATVLGRGEDPQWLYTVCFDGRELWGEDGDPSVRVSIEAFEPYLEPA